MRALIGMVAMATAAHAEGPPSGGMAVGVNGSLLEGKNLGGSVSVGFAGHHALRINLAHYQFEDHDDLTEEGGWFSDGSLGYVLFPRRLWSGPMLEVAVLHRRRETVLERDPLDGDPYEALTTTTIAGRFLIGWTWDLHEHFFVSLAVGISRGRETGRETIGHLAYGQMEPTLVERDISRMTTAAEGIVRVGTMIGW